MSSSLLKDHQHRPFILFFLGFLILGLFIYKDYGISWDEPISRERNGILNVEFIQKGNSNDLLVGSEKYHGPSFEIVLALLEKSFGMKDEGAIYQMRHLVTFLVQAFALVIFYLLCFRNFKSSFFALTAAMFLVISPRIFADTFYNSKDLTFLSFAIFTLATTINFLEKKTIRSGILNGLITAFLIDIRILGIIYPCFTFLILAKDFLISPDQRKRIFISSVSFALSLIAFMILFWPVLWLGPIEQFILAWQEMRTFPWNDNVLFAGRVIFCTELPWEYIPGWIAITTPVFYLALFFTGLFFIVRNVFRSVKPTTFEWLNLYVIFMPLFAVIVLHSVVYDGWRHLYFIYPSMIFIAVLGMKQLIEGMARPRAIRIVKTMIFVYVGYVAFIMIKLHPYEQIYFNFLGGSSYGEARKKYEGDYWGLSYKEALEFIAKHDSSTTIYICPGEMAPARNNLMLLPENERCRFSLTNALELSDYLVTTSRFFYGSYRYEPDYTIKRDGGAVISIFDLRKKGVAWNMHRYLTAQYHCDFEATSEIWKDALATNDPHAFNGQRSVRITPQQEYSLGMNMSPTTQMTDTNYLNYLYYELMIRSTSNCNIDLVFEVDTLGKKSYEWLPFKIKTTLPGRWERKTIRIKMPRIYSPTDVVQLYFWNHSTDTIFVDDFHLGFFSVPLSEKKSISDKLPYELYRNRVLP